MASFRSLYKKGMTRTTFEERIENAKLRQRNIRKKLLAKARSLISNRGNNTSKDEMDVDKVNDNFDNSDNNMSTDRYEHNNNNNNNNNNRGKQKRVEYAAQLVEPEWMIRLPNDLFLLDEINNTNTTTFDDTENEAGWYVIPRIEGHRCLVISNHGKTISRDKNGNIIHRFHSILPNGGNSNSEYNNNSLSIYSSGTNNNFSIFDCIYNDELKAYFVLDVMCWKGQSFYACTASFRFYWAQSKLNEIGVEDYKFIGGNNNNNNNNNATWNNNNINDDSLPSYPIYSLPHYHSSKDIVNEILVFANNSNHNAYLDGLIFVAKSSYYEPGLLPSPLWLLWKNTNSCRYFRPAKELVVTSNDSNNNKNCLILDNIVLKSNENCTFMLTREGIPILSREHIIFYSNKNVRTTGQSKKKNNNKHQVISNWSMLKPNTLYKFQLSLDININNNSSDNKSFLKELMVLSYNSEIDGIKNNNMNAVDDMHTMHKYFTSTLNGKASKRRIYSDSYTKICFHMFPSIVV